MKKFYTLALAAATLISASAAVRQTEVTNFKSFPVQETTSVLSTATADIKAVGFSSIDEVAGDYDWNFYGLLTGESGPAVGLVTITVTNAAKGEVTIDGIYSAGSGIKGKIKGTVDLKAGTLTVANKQDLGKDQGGDQNYFYFKDLDEEGYLIDGASAAASVTATISGKSFIFPQECVFAVGDFNDEELGWWKLTVENSFDEYVEPSDMLDLTEWNTYGTATMIDGWILPTITYEDDTYVDPNDFPLNVTILQNKENAKLFAVANPYVAAESGFPVGGGEEGYIVIDITYPDFVIVQPHVYSGFKNGTNRLFCLNMEGFYIAAGYDKLTIMTALKDKVEAWSTYTEDDETINIDIPNCRFNYAGELDKIYTWIGRADAMKAKITINKDAAGVDNVAVDNENAPVEYYNLQGIRVDNPAKGQVVIKKQGSKASKILVK